LSKEVMDDVGHGTHVAGIIGAIGNNATGATGVCWGVKILPLRIIKAVSGGTYGTYSAAIGALDYIRTLNTSGRKVAVANHSWGCNGYSLAMLNAINNPVATGDPLPVGITSTYLASVNTFTVAGSSPEIAKIKVGMTITGPGIPSGTLVTIVNGNSLTLSDYTTTPATNGALVFSNPVRPKPYGVVHVAAAGNSQFNSDRIPVYPACLPSGFIVSVGATDTSDNPAVWSGGAGSNFGRLNVDIFAPGSSIWSTKWKAPGDPDYGYESRNGTSMAAPQVAGAAVLIRMWQPNLTELQARQVLIEQVAPVTALNGKCVSGGRLNVAKVIDRLYQPNLVSSSGGTAGGSTMLDALQASQSITGRLAMSVGHTLFVDQGEVWAWGTNSAGNLGDGTTSPSATPKKVLGLTDIVMVAASDSNSYALKSDGTVWAWGFAHLIGNGSSTSPTRPVQVQGLSDVVWISGGRLHALAVRADGTVWAWGSDNSFGQIGDGSTTTRLIPVEVAGVSNVVQAEVGDRHSIALRADGTVYAWGSGTSGQLGDGVSSGSVLTAILVPGMSDVVFVEASHWGSIFLKADGTVWRTGTLSRSSVQPSSTSVPVQIPSLQNIRVVCAGEYHMLALDDVGRLFAGGDAANGDLGTGSLDPVWPPVQVQFPSANNVISIAAGKESSLVLDGEGKLWATGCNRDGQLGLAKNPASTIPVRIPQLSGVVAIGGGRNTAWARMADGTFKMWGLTTYTTTTSTALKFQTPTPFPVLDRTVLEVQSGTSAPSFTRFVARCGDGTIWTWGSDVNNLGRGGGGQPSQQPVRITSLQNISVVACQTQVGMAAADATGALYTWGQTPSAGSLTGVVGLAGGYDHFVALKSNGTVWTWGGNQYGQLGNGTKISSRSTPVQVTGLTAIVQVAATKYASFAVTASGSIYGWGKDGYCFAHDTGGSEPPVTSFLTPVLIYSPTQGTVTKLCLDSEGDQAVVLLSDHTVVDWGQISSNLGRQPGASVDATTPYPVFGATSVIDIAQAGLGPFFFLKSDGTVWTCGKEAGAALNGTNGLGASWGLQFAPVVGFGGASTTLSTLGTGSTTDSWYLQNFSVPELLNDSLVSDLATPAGDGIPNLLKYALGLNPKTRADAASLPSLRVDLIGGSAQSTSARGGIGLFSVPTVDLANGKHYLAFSVPRNGIHQDVNYIVEVSTDLVNWRSGDPHTVTVLDTAETLEVYSATAVEDSPRQFMRLKIQRK